MASVIVREYDPNPAKLPGAYQNSVAAMIRREQAQSGTDLVPGTGSDSWDVQAGGGHLVFRIAYERAVPTRGRRDLKLYSGVTPTFFRTYHMEEAVEVVKSLPTGIDRLRSYHLQVTIPELGKVFDGSEELVGITLHPMVVRQVFLP
jgi:hypothetical protein